MCTVYIYYYIYCIAVVKEASVYVTTAGSNGAELEVAPYYVYYEAGDVDINAGLSDSESL